MDDPDSRRPAAPASAFERFGWTALALLQTLLLATAISAGAHPISIMAFGMVDVALISLAVRSWRR